MSLSWLQTVTFNFLIVIFKIIITSSPTQAASFSTSYFYNSNQGKPIFKYNFQPGGNIPANIFMKQPQLPTNINVQQPQQQQPINLNVPKVNMNFPQQPPNMNMNLPQQPINPGKSVFLSDKDAFLQTHNEDRKAVGDPPLIWDDKIAAFAQSWANQRINDCRLVHSNGPYGENIFWGSGDYPADSIVQAWASEGKNYDRNSNSCVGGMCEHYTQLMWKASTRLGCAKITCSNGGIFATCNYDPPGNFLGSRPY